MANQFGEVTRFKEREIVLFEPWPSVKHLIAWKTSFRGEVTIGSGRPEEALVWLYEMNDAKNHHDLISSTSRQGQNFATLDMKIANALWRIMPGDLKRRVSIWDSLQEKQYNKMLNGRQLAWIIFDYFNMPEVTVRMFRLDDSPA